MNRAVEERDPRAIALPRIAKGSDIDALDVLGDPMPLELASRAQTGCATPEKAAEKQKD